MRLNYALIFLVYFLDGGFRAGIYGQGEMEADDEKPLGGDKKFAYY